MKTVFLVIIYFFFFSFTAITQPGTLDKSFGTKGRIITDLNDKDNEANDVIIQPDKKIIVIGTASERSYTGFGLVRYLPDGKLDNTFGLKGKVVTNINNRIFAKGNCGVLQPDGKIIAGGYTSAQSGNDFTLVRYKSDGKVDSSFGVNGIVITVLGTGEGFQSLHILPGGKILAAGFSSAISPNPDFILYRYESNGKIDSTFGSNGVAATDYGFDYAYSMVVQKDGKIVLGGNTHNYRNGLDYLMMVRYSSQGKLDSTFGTNGSVITNFHRPGSITCKAMAIQPDGKLVLGGYGATQENQFTHSFIARFLSNGNPDKSFGEKGVVEINTKHIQLGTAAGVQANGKIMFGGYISLGTYGYENFALACYNSYGKIDSTFGDEGFVSTDFNKQQDWASAMAIQPDGDIILAGYTYPPVVNGTYSDKDFAVARYNFERAIIRSELSNSIKDEIKIYPNPVKNILTIERLPIGGENKFTITDLNGNVRMVTKSNAVTFSINLTQLQKGNYILKIENGDKIITRKIVKE